MPQLEAINMILLSFKFRRKHHMDFTDTSTNREYKDRLFKAIFGRNTEETKTKSLGVCGKSSS